jgi:hypothetical protein
MSNRFKPRRTSLNSLAYGIVYGPKTNKSKVKRESTIAPIPVVSAPRPTKTVSYHPANLSTYNDNTLGFYMITDCGFNHSGKGGVFYGTRDDVWTFLKECDEIQGTDNGGYVIFSGPVKIWDLTTNQTKQ